MAANSPPARSEGADAYAPCTPCAHVDGKGDLTMATSTTVLQMYVRVIGVIMIVLGLLFWTGNANGLIPVHMLLGITLVLALWALAVLAALAGVNVGLVVLALVWGLIVVALGLTQTRLL